MTAGQIIMFASFGAIVIAAIAGLPYLVTRLTGPTWALAKSCIEGLFFALLLSTFLPFFAVVPAVVVIAMLRYKGRVKRYATVVAGADGHESSVDVPS